MSPVEGRTLPGTPPPTLQALWEALTPPQRAAAYDHLTGDTSADWLASTFRAVGLSVSPSTIRYYRRSLASD